MNASLVYWVEGVGDWRILHHIEMILHLWAGYKDLLQGQRDFQGINYLTKIKSPHLNNNDNHFKGVGGGWRRQPPLTPLNIHENFCTL